MKIDKTAYKTALCFRFAQTLLQVGQADLLGAVFAIVLRDNLKAIMYSLRSYVFKSKSSKVRTLRDALYLPFKIERELVIRGGNGRTFVVSLVDTR